MAEFIFWMCLLLPVYTITGYDASAHTSEETKNAATSVPKGIVSAVLWSSLVGWVMISAIMLAMTMFNRCAGRLRARPRRTVNAKARSNASTMPT